MSPLWRVAMAKESDGDETNEEHALGFLTLDANGFFLNLDDAVASASGNRAGTRGSFSSSSFG